MSNKLDITENHLEVLSLFTKGYDGEFYIREVCRLVSVSHGTAWNVLQSLEDLGVADSVLKGRIRVFRLKKSPAAQNYLLLAESYKRLRFSGKYPFADEILYRITPWFQGPLALFGSHSSGEAQKDSDIDLLATGVFNEDEVRTVSKKFGIKTNVKKYESALFMQSAQGDYLVREMYKNHIFLKCPEFFVGAVMRE